MGIILIFGAVQTHITVCGVVETIPNNHPSHVAYDTSAQVPDTGAVDLVKRSGKAWSEGH